MVAMCCSLPLPLPSSSTSRSPDILQLHQHCQHYCHQINRKFERFLKLFVDPLPLYQKTLQPIIESWIDYSQWASSETVYSSWQGRGYFLAFSITQRLQSSSSGERTVSADGPTYIFWTKSGQAALTICLTFFLYCVRSLYSLYSILKNHQCGLIVTSVKSLVRSDRKIFTVDRSDSECRRSRWLPPRLLRPFLVLPSLVQTDQTPFLTFYQTQVLALACLVIHHSMGLLCLSQCLICRPQHSGFFIFAFHWSHGAEIENINMHSFFFPLFFRCDSHSLPPV